MTEEQLEELELEHFDNNDRLEDVIAKIEEKFSSSVWENTSTLKPNLKK